MPAVDHHHVGVGVLDQRVDEPHAERARAHDEVVRLEVSRHASIVRLQSRSYHEGQLAGSEPVGGLFWRIPPGAPRELKNCEKLAPKAVEFPPWYWP